MLRLTGFQVDFHGVSVCAAHGGFSVSLCLAAIGCHYEGILHLSRAQVRS